MKKNSFVINDDFRMKVVNFLSIYGYYKGVLSKLDVQKKYINGEVELIDIINSKKEFKELKNSIKVVLEYCYDNHFSEIEHIMNYFYKVECLKVRNLYGSIFDRLG